MTEYIEAGKIVNTRGTKGEVKIQVWCDSVSQLLDFDFFYVDKEKLTIKVESSKEYKGNLLVKFSGIDNLTDAEKLKNKIIYIEKSALPLSEGAYFIKDLVGIEVFDADTFEDYGKLTNVFQTGANDVYEIAGKSGETRLVPAIKEVIISVDLKEKKMLIRPLKGLFD